MIIRSSKNLRIISIHATREGGDALWSPVFVAALLFQSTPPVRAATKTQRELWRKVDISIHATREGGDQKL